jgi:hypothetical protein
MGHYDEYRYPDESAAEKRAARAKERKRFARRKARMEKLIETDGLSSVLTQIVDQIQNFSAKLNR